MTDMAVAIYVKGVGGGGDGMIRNKELQIVSLIQSKHIKEKYIEGFRLLHPFGLT